MMQHAGRMDEIERAVLERQRPGVDVVMQQLGRRAMQRQALARLGERAFRHVDADQPRRLRLRRKADQIVARPAAEIEHPQLVGARHRHQVDVSKILRVAPVEIVERSLRRLEYAMQGDIVARPVILDRARRGGLRFDRRLRGFDGPRRRRLGRRQRQFDRLPG